MPVDPSDPTKRRMPMMTDADMAMKMDPVYERICQKFMADPDVLRRHLRPRLVQADPSRHGPEIALSSARKCPAEDLIWQDPVPAGPTGYDVDAVKAKIAATGLSVADMVATAWDSARPSAARTSAAAPTARASASRRRRTGRATSRRASRSVIVGAGADRGRDRRQRRRRDRAGRQRRRREGGESRGPRRRRSVHAGPRSTRPTGLTDAESFDVLEPLADGFRNWLKKEYAVPRGAADRPRAASGADRAGDDGSGRRHAGAGRQPRRLGSTASSPTARARSRTTSSST